MNLIMQCNGGQYNNNMSGFVNGITDSYFVLFKFRDYIKANFVRIDFGRFL